MEVDISDYAMGGVLFMECKDKRQKLVVFLSKSLNKIERNYEIYDKEILVVIRGQKTGDTYQKAPSLSSKSGWTIRIQNTL